MNDTTNSVIDPSILFGGASDAPVAAAPTKPVEGGIPDFLKRHPDVQAGHAEEVKTVEADFVPQADTVVTISEEITKVEADFVTQQHDPAFTTQVNPEGQTELVVQGQDAHSAPENPRATIGDNQPPEEPMSREEMLKEFNKDIAAYGKDSGKGAAALPRLGLRVVRAAADGLISTDKPKDGSESDAVRIYKRYAEQDSKHAEHTKGGMKANAAKVNALIGLGSMTMVDGVDVAARTVAIRDKMEAEDQKPKALFAGLVDVARKQMESDTPLTDEAIAGALGKVVKDKSVAEEWTAIYKKVEKLVTGENAQGLKDQSERAMAIAEQINEHINAFTVDEDRADRIAFCMERGMTREQATKFVDTK